jgi:protein SCO1/2
MYRTRLTGAVALLLSLVAGGCERTTQSGATNIDGVMPGLAFSLVRASDDAAVTAADYRGRIVLLYFGYTRCPDECPTTLANLAAMLRRLGRAGNNVRVLFVSVDPGPDTVPVLRTYVRSFGPQIDGLRGDANTVTALARRYRVLFSVSPGTANRPYSVMHSDTLFIFDNSGRPRWALTSTDDIAALASRIQGLGS